MENLLKIDQYAYMEGLNRFRNFLVNTQYDLSRRDWVAKTIDEHGYIRLQPDTYSPQMLESILRYALSIDERERIASERLDLDFPRFRLVDPDSLVAIDALWSLNGIHRPFHALKVWKEVVIDGMLVDIPDVDPFPRIKFPPPRYLHVGSEWDDSPLYPGLYLPKMLYDAEYCGFESKQISNGREILNIGVDSPFTVNEEGLPFLFLYEIDRLLETYHDNPAYGFSTAYLWYATCGMISINKNQLSRIDRILRRTQYKEDIGLNGAPDVSHLLPLALDRRPEVLLDPPPSAYADEYPLFELLKEEESCLV